MKIIPLNPDVQFTYLAINGEQYIPVKQIRAAVQAELDSMPEELNHMETGAVVALKRVLQIIDNLPNKPTDNVKEES